MLHLEKCSVPYMRNGVRILKHLHKSPEGMEAACSPNSQEVEKRILGAREPCLSKYREIQEDIWPPHTCKKRKKKCLSVSCFWKVVLLSSPFECVGTYISTSSLSRATMFFPAGIVG